MANSNARKYLNDTSMENLEKSIGTKMVINKQRKIGEIVEIIYGYWDQISANNEKIASNKQEIEALRKTNLLKKLFNIGKIKMQIEVLKEQIDALESKNAEIKSTVSRYEYELESLRRQIENFGEELSKVGLTVDDIIKEYEIITSEIKEEKNKGQTPAPETKPEVKTEPKVEQQKPTEPKRPVQNVRLSPRERFENRLKKTQEIQARKNENSAVEQEKE